MKLVYKIGLQSFVSSIQINKFVRKIKNFDFLWG